MKRFLLLAATIAVFTSACGSAAYAQDASTSASSSAKPRTPKLEAKQERVQVKIASIQDRVASRTAQLKLKLNNFRDQKRAQVVERVNDSLAKINQIRTDNMLKNLSSMSNIISKLENRVNGVTDKDTTAAKSAIDSAKIAISTAQTAVTAQSQKDYPIEATSEATIKDEVVGARLNLHSDLKTIHELVVAARKAVGKAIETTVQTLTGRGTNGQQ